MFLGTVIFVIQSFLQVVARPSLRYLIDSPKLRFFGLPLAATNTWPATDEQCTADGAGHFRPQ